MYKPNWTWEHPWRTGIQQNILYSRSLTFSAYACSMASEWCARTAEHFCCVLQCMCPITSAFVWLQNHLWFLQSHNPSGSPSHNTPQIRYTCIDHWQTNIPLCITWRKKNIAEIDPKWLYCKSLYNDSCFHQWKSKIRLGGFH